MFNKYILNFQGFNVNGITVNAIYVGGSNVLGSPFVMASLNDLIQYIQATGIGAEGMLNGSNSMSFYSKLDFTNLGSDGATIAFTSDDVDYVLGSTGCAAVTQSAFDDNPYPSYTISVTINKSTTFPSGFLRLMIKGTTVFFGDTIAFCKKYNRDYSVDGDGNITVTLSYPNEPIVNPFSTLTKLCALFNDIMELASYGVGGTTNSWSEDGALSMVDVYSQQLNPAILCNSNDLL